VIFNDLRHYISVLKELGQLKVIEGASCDLAVALRVISKYMKVSDPKRLDAVYEASLGRMPAKPYPREEAVQLELESIAFTDPSFKNKKASEFMDTSIVGELERKGFFAQLQ